MYKSTSQSFTLLFILKRMMAEYVRRLLLSVCSHPKERVCKTGQNIFTWSIPRFYNICLLYILYCVLALWFFLIVQFLVDHKPTNSNLLKTHVLKRTKWDWFLKGAYRKEEKKNLWLNFTWLETFVQFIFCNLWNIFIFISIFPPLTSLLSHICLHFQP